MFPEKLKEALIALAEEEEVYVAGGPVRDALLGRRSKDLDLVVPQEAARVSHHLAQRLGTKLVVLDEEEGVFRLPLEEDFFLDISQFRKNATTIDEDLKARDFTINALAVELKTFLTRKAPLWPIIDPTGGLKDLEKRLIRAISRANLLDDPLRFLRAYRLAAELAFVIEADTRQQIRALAPEINKVARERVGFEIRLLFENPCGLIVSLMAEDKLLFEIWPELKEAEGVAQPTFHHLDVLGHLLLSLEMADLVLENPLRYFPSPTGENPFSSSLKTGEARSVIRLAALFHDVGKPHTFALRHRITFYEHDRMGAEIFTRIGQRLCFSKKFIKQVAILIKNHMRPFHLLREFRAGRLSKRAMRRLLKDCPDYPALFVVAMADSLASAGPDKEEGLEAELASLFWEIHRFHEETLSVQGKERLVTGRDLIELFGLEPGPIFKELLEAVEEARVEGYLKTREEALSFLAELIRKKFAQNP